MNLLTLLLLCIIPLGAAQRPNKGAGRNCVPIILNDQRPRKRQKKYLSNRRKRVLRAAPVDEAEVDRLLQRHPCASRESVVALVAGLVMVPDLVFHDEE